MTNLIMAMLPSIGIYFLGCMGLCYVVWYVLDHRFPAWHLPVWSPAPAALIITLFYGLGSIVFVMQNRAMVAVMQAKPAEPAAIDSAAQVGQMKTTFLVTIENLLTNPTQLTAESKAALYQQFASLFPQGAADRQFYYNQISLVYLCQKQFYEDALNALKSKKSVKSEIRQKCQMLDGQFFGRPKLIPETVASTNDDTIEKLAAGKKIMQNDQEIKVDEGYLRQGLEEQARKLEVLKLIFD